MIYLIFGNQTPAIRKNMSKIVSSVLPECDDMNYVRYDATSVLIQEAIEDTNYLPLGYDHKVVAVENCYFLEGERKKNKLESDQNYQVLIDFINHPSDECDLILTVHNSKLDEKNEIFKLIREKGKILEIKDPKAEEWPVMVKKYVTSLGVNIRSDAVSELAARTSGDMALLMSSAQKLALYTNDIQYEDVALMVTRPLEENTFAIFNYLLKDENDKAISLFRDLRVLNIEPVYLIGQLANSFRLLNQVQYLSKQGLSNEDIAKELGVKSVIRIQILRKSIASISEKAIHRTLDDLFNLDLQIKSGLVDRFYSFELFLINFKRS